MLRRQPVRIVEATLPPLGIVPALPGEPPPNLTLSRDGSLFVASDGITEAFNAAGEMFGEWRVAHVLDEEGAPPPDTIASLKSAVWAWQGKEEPVDDQTVVVVARK